MKKLILINGTMGVGKTATGKELLALLPRSVFLDGDWCWNMNPFLVTEETKDMVMDNITHLLRNFLTCSVYDHVIFCWVMHEESILEQVLSRLEETEYELHKFTLTCSEQALTDRLSTDVANGLRQSDIIARSLLRLPLYDAMSTVKIEVSGISAWEAAKKIIELMGQEP